MCASALFQFYDICQKNDRTDRILQETLDDMHWNANYVRKIYISRSISQIFIHSEVFNSKNIS